MTEERLSEVMHLLGERIKELNCLYDFSNLIEKSGMSLKELLQSAVDLIPAAMQYPEITCARITLEGEVYATGNYRKTRWRQAEGIFANGSRIGSIEAVYLERRPGWKNDPFLQEEKVLLSAIAKRTGKIIEQKRTEAALFEMEKRFRDLVENAIIGIAIIQNDQVIYQNPVQERLCGPLPRKTKLVEIESMYPDDIEKVKEFYKNISSKMLRIQETDFRFYPPEKVGSTCDLRWVHCQANAINYQGKDAILINMMDVTRAKQLEAFLRSQDKMSSLGHVAAGIAHEIRNPLSGINIYLNALEKLYDKGENGGKIGQILVQIQSASNKIESVIRRVMDFSKPSNPKFVLTDLDQPVEDAVGLASVTLRKRGIKIEKKLAHDLPMVNADAQLIEEVVLNLITNAAEAMKNAKDQKQIEIISFAENNHVCVRVSDSGPGVPLELREKIFDPFFTTKTESTGIGLSLCHRIVSDHEGNLQVSENRWGGAAFTIRLPIKTPGFSKV